MPYQADDQIPCENKCDDWTNQLFPIKDCGEQWVGFDSQENRDIVKSLIHEMGPIATGINVTEDFIEWGNRHHKENEYYPDTHEPWANRLNHIVVIVGWYDDENLLNNGYWICKNSWGTDWGYDGFFNIEYGGLFTATYVAWVDYEGNNSFPNKPMIPIGPNQGNINEEYTYSFSSSDPDNDDVYYLVDWKDDSSSEWLGPYPSNQTMSISHIWNKKGSYDIQVKVKDVHGYESEWSDSLEISMPKNKVQNFFKKLFFNLFENYFQQIIFS
jgi:hypothetical protein